MRTAIKKKYFLIYALVIAPGELISKLRRKPNEPAAVKFTVTG